jgi:hypothetical protein
MVWKLSYPLGSAHKYRVKPRTRLPKPRPVLPTHTRKDKMEDKELIVLVL